jgi:Putative stress-induced transcription regulator
LAALEGGPIVQRRPPAIFIADSLSLDFLNSIATPLDKSIDWLDSGDGLLNWLAQAKLVPADALGELKPRAMPGELDKVADQARTLREWFRGFVRKHIGRPLTPKALRELAPLNRLLERDEAWILEPSATELYVNRICTSLPSSLRIA